MTIKITEQTKASSFFPVNFGSNHQGEHPAVLFHSMYAMKHMLGIVLETNQKSNEEKNYPLDPQANSSHYKQVKVAAIKGVGAVHPSWPMNYHNIRASSFWNGTVTLEDGSQWEVSSFFKTLAWSTHDPIRLYRNWDFFSSYEYVLINEATGSSVEANMTLVGAEYYGPLSHWITHIDYGLSRVYLENGSYWTIDPDNYVQLLTWGVGDHVIIGEASGLLMGYDSIMINYNQNQCVYAYEF